MLFVDILKFTTNISALYNRTSLEFTLILTKERNIITADIMKG